MQINPEMVVAASAIITSIGTAVAAVITSRGNSKRIEIVGAKVGQVAETNEAIHTAVNSNATAQQAKIDALLARIEDLMSAASEKAKIAAVLAAVPLVTPVVPAAQAEEITPTKRRRK